MINFCRFESFRTLDDMRSLASKLGHHLKSEIDNGNAVEQKSLNSGPYLVQVKHLRKIYVGAIESRDA